MFVTCMRRPNLIYADATKTKFKSSTRLECMMQDYPKALPSSAKVGFTVINQVGPEG